MARQLKTYTTSGGFFDLAIAAPSMKAALEAWGARNNLFQHGFAKQSEDADVIAATMAKPGVVLRRPVGSDGAFSEHAELPTNLGPTRVRKAEKPPAKKKVPAKKPAPSDDKASRKAALAFEKEQRRRQAEQRREEESRQKVRERRDRAIAAAEAALAEARQAHEEKVREIEKERAAVDRRAEAEDARWKKSRDQLDDALRKARSVSYLRPV